MGSTRPTLALTLTLTLTRTQESNAPELKAALADHRANPQLGVADELTVPAEQVLAFHGLPWPSMTFHGLRSMTFHDLP